MANTSEKDKMGKQEEEAGKEGTDRDAGFNADPRLTADAYVKSRQLWNDFINKRISGAELQERLEKYEDIWEKGLEIMDMFSGEILD